MRAFLLLVGGGGLGGFLGSVIGAALGDKPALFAGGVIGGLIVSPAAAWLAARLRWIEPASVTGAAIGATVGFAAAVAVAVNTLSSPVGPVLSPLLVGAGGLLGAKIQAARRR
jgi:hypothetical protein